MCCQIGSPKSYQIDRALDRYFSEGTFNLVVQHEIKSVTRTSVNVISWKIAIITMMTNAGFKP